MNKKSFFSITLTLISLVISVILANSFQSQTIFATNQLKPSAALVKQVEGMNLPNEQLLKTPVMTVSNFTLNPPQATDIDDGLTWSGKQDNLEIGYTNPMTVNGKTVRMGFTFGKLSATSFSGQPNRNANIFLQDGSDSKGNPNNIPAFHGGVTNGPETSMDYTLFEGDRENSSINSFMYTSLLTYGHQLTYFVSKSNGTVQAVKVMGYCTNGDSSDSFEFEEILRRSPYRNGNVSQELYVKNISSSSQLYLIGEHEDTELESNMIGTSYIPARVPIYALGNNRGMYLESPNHRLNVNFDLTNGPAHWLAEAYNDRFSYSPSGLSNSVNGNKTQIFKGPDFDHITGQEADNWPAGRILLQTIINPVNKQKVYPDSGYAVLWSKFNSPVGQTQHYALDIGMGTSTQSSPKLIETWLNGSRKNNDKNYPGDKIQFTVNLGNDGKDSEYKTTNLSDLVPAGIDVDNSSFKLTYANGTTKSVTYNAANRGLQLSDADAIDLKDNQTATLTFSGTISDSASGQALTTTPKAIAIEQKSDGNPARNFSGEPVNIPLSHKFKAELTQDASDQTHTELPANYYIPGDTIDFHIHYKINADITDSVSELHFKPSVSAGLTATGHVTATMDNSETNSLKVTYQQTGGSPWPSQVNVTKSDGTAFKAGDQLTVTITGIAKPDDQSDGKLSQTVDVVGTLDSGEAIASNSNTLTIYRQNLTRLSVPKNIDFGTHYKGEATEFLNPELDANLKVESGVELNSNSVFLVSAQGNEPLAGGLFLKDQNNQWQDLSTPTSLPVPAPAPATDAGYQYIYDFSALIQSKKWKLEVPVNAQKPGQANQTVTWTISNSL